VVMVVIVVVVAVVVAVVVLVAVAVVVMLEVMMEKVVVMVVRTTKKTPGVLALEVNQSNVDVHYSKMLWEDITEGLQDIGEVNPLQFGRFLGMFTSLFCGGPHW